MVSLQKVLDLFVGFFLPNKNQNGNLEYLLALRFTISSSSPARRAQCRNARCFFIHTQHLLPVPLAHGVSTEHVFLIHCVYVLHYCCLVLVIDNYFHKKFAKSRQHHYNTPARQLCHMHPPIHDDLYLSPLLRVCCFLFSLYMFIMF